LIQKKEKIIKIAKQPSSPEGQNYSIRFFSESSPSETRKTKQNKTKNPKPQEKLKKI